MRIIHIVLSFAFFTTVSVTLAQKANPDETSFKNGKQLLDLGKYGLAMQAFRPLTSAFNDNGFQAISSYYYAVAAFNNNQPYVARDMFLQIGQNYPNWKKLDEVNLWLTNIYLKEGDYKAGLNFAQKIHDDQIKSEASALKITYLKNLNFIQLNSLLQSYPSDKDIAVSLADKIVQLPISEQDRGLLENLVSVFELDEHKYGLDVDIKSIKKDTYQVAVLLPFMLDELKNNTKHISNEFVIELYEGILMGVADLKNQGIKVSLHLYDTKKDSTVTSRILQYDELKHMDLIIGPLYPGPVKVVSDFAFKNHINMINPLSSTAEIIGENPFAFLFMPTDETMARKTAIYMQSIHENKNLMIFHGTNQKDSLMAYTYKQEIESHGFKVCYINAVAIENAKTILDILTNTLTVEVDESEFDKLVDQGKVKGNLRISEKNFLIIKPDSIGHVFIASNEQALVANAITGLETRGDTIMLLGNERWLDQRAISIGGLERLHTHLIAPTFIDKSKPKYEGLNSLYMEQFNAYPTRNFYTGYELMMTVGKMMNRMGNLFQFDQDINSFIAGELFQGTRYGEENSNQIVPIIKFEDSDLIVANPKF